MESADCVVIGAGVIGLACAAELAAAGREVIILEAAGSWGQGISSRNSEVIHAGLYYPPGSLKARCCVAGNRELKHFADAHQVPWQPQGKWLVATEEAQQPLLARLQQRAAANGVALHRVEPARLRREEPALRAAAALESPRSAIIDSHALMQALLARAQDLGACLLPAHRVAGISRERVLSVGFGVARWSLRARYVVNAAGLGAVDLLPGPRPRLHYAKGSYFSYQGAVPFSRLIYPLPVAGGLGIHLCLDQAGRARFGPDVQWVETAQDLAVDPARAEAFGRDVRQWWPELDVARLQPDYAGIRPKLSGRGEADADFLLQGEQQHGVPGLVNFLGIESPGLTAALPLARLATQQLGLSVAPAD